MNKVFKVIWNEARNAYVVVSEIAKNHGSKSCSTKKLLAMLIATGVMTCASFDVLAAETATQGTVAQQYVALKAADFPATGPARFDKNTWGATVLRTTQESLRTVPQSYREGAFGLGAGKWRVVRTVVLPGCIDGIVTGCILSAGRILGESAALLFTAGFAHTLNKFVIGLASPGATLTVALYAYAKEEGEFDVAFAIAAILMILTLLINLAAGIVGKQIQKRSRQ